MKKIIVLTVCSAVFLSNCAGREANPVDVIQARDASLSCNNLGQEISINNELLFALLAQQKNKKGQNAVAGVAGAIVFFPALLFMDLKGAAGEEARALQARNKGLAERYRGQGCKPALKTQ